MSDDRPMTEEEFWAALAPLPPQPESSYRLYYDDGGYPLFYSMEDCPGNYIELDLETWKAQGPVRVVDGKLVKIKTAITHKLVPGEAGTSCHPDNVAVVVSDVEPNIKWSLN
jgi:hypothetical protein